MSKIPRKLGLAVLLLAGLAAGGCNLSSLSKILNPTGTSVQSVTVAPDSAQVAVGGTIQFTALVLPTGVPNRAVTWSVSPTTAGTIDANGVLTAAAPGPAVV